MAKILNHWAVSLVVAVSFTGCGIFHFADPLAMEESPGDLLGVPDLRQVNADAGTEPMGFCAKQEYALRGSSSKVLACWDEGKPPSLQGCDANKWKFFPASADIEPSWGFSSDFDLTSPLACSLLDMESMNFAPTSKLVIKIDHKRTMPRALDFIGVFSYRLLYIPSDPSVIDVPVLASWNYATDGYVKDEIPVSVPEPSKTYKRGIALRAMRTRGTQPGIPGWFIRGLAIIQK